jgi:hypothetical protein
MAAREGCCDSDVSDYRRSCYQCELIELTDRCRTSTKESRLVEYLSTFDAPVLTDAEIASIDEAGGKEYHRQFVRSSFGTVALLSADIPK